MTTGSNTKSHCWKIASTTSKTKIKASFSCNLLRIDTAICSIRSKEQPPKKRWSYGD